MQEFDLFMTLVFIQNNRKTQQSRRTYDTHYKEFIDIFTYKLITQLKVCPSQILLSIVRIRTHLTTSRAS